MMMESSLPESRASGSMPCEEYGTEDAIHARLLSGLRLRLGIMHLAMTIPMYAVGNK